MKTHNMYFVDIINDKDTKGYAKTLFIDGYANCDTCACGDVNNSCDTCIFENDITLTEWQLKLMDRLHEGITLPIYNVGINDEIVVMPKFDINYLTCRNVICSNKNCKECKLHNNKDGMDIHKF